MAKECSNSSCTKESCEGCASRQPQSFRAEMNKDSNIGKVIGVISGKGGVGKSMVTASIANQLAAQGFQVGVLDADITGPSIPRMYGIKEAAAASERGIEPRVAENGIKIMSINLLLKNEDDPVIWRGPVIANMVKQFWTDVIWGNLDFLLVDMPPGTGDVPLTVFQSLPVDGVVVVTSPQDLVKMIVKKAVKMAEMMKIPVLGVVENYSYAVCPDCGKKIPIFGESKVDQVAMEYQLPVLGRIPVHPEYAKAADEGRFHQIKVEELKSILG
ncbi:MAG: P-loop NTPase [Ruminococcus sp.]|jgi:Mrp family chromosome partitioning ATPase